MDFFKGPRKTLVVREVPSVTCIDPNKTYGDFRDDLNRDVSTHKSLDLLRSRLIHLLKGLRCGQRYGQVQGARLCRPDPRIPGVVVCLTVRINNVLSLSHTLSPSLQSGLGYKRDDPSTIREECLPVISEKGMIQQ